MAAPHDPTNPDAGKPTCLLLIDIQQAFATHTSHFGPSASSSFAAALPATVTSLLAHFRAHGRPVIHVKHDSTSRSSPLHPSHPGNALQPFALPLPHEPVFAKNVNSPLVGTPLAGTLAELGVRRLVVAGLTTDHCVSTTVRMAANMDVVGTESGDGEIWLVRDGCAAFEKGGVDAETVHNVNLVSLEGEFCRVLRGREVLDLLEAEG